MKQPGPADAADALDERVAPRIPPLLWALSAGFAFFAIVTLVVRPPGAALPLALIDIGGALLLGAAGLLFRARGVPKGFANAIGGAALLLTLAASLVAIKILHLPAQTTNILLVELLAGIILLSMRWTGGVLAASIVGWTGVAWSEGFGDAWLNAGFSLIATTIMSVMIQIVRLRDASRYARILASEREHVRALARANQSLEAFAYVISHDLKEPIRATTLFLDEARESPTPSERDEHLARAIASHERLARLAGGLLEWSRAITTPVEPSPVDVEELLRDDVTRAQFESPLEERRAKLLVESGLPRVMGTPALVRQVLGNLILNAVRHNDRPDPQVRIYAAPDSAAGFVDLVVEDNGPGFPASAIAGRAGGVGGFGLLIARRAAERMGGGLHITNRPEGGAAVHVTLPRADEGAPKRPSLPSRSSRIPS